ncbi:MAG: hypothetical protein AAFV49_17225 [Pseudomonadota bacterium]
MLWSRDIVSPAEAEWATDGFQWLIERFGAETFFDETRLVLPTRAFFDAPGGRSHATALAVFEQVRGHMGMADWPCRLERQTPDADTAVGDLALLRDAPAGPLGTFGVDDASEVVITYNPALLDRPLAFVATMAHELAHYLLASEAEETPGGEALHELFTDLTVIACGFGVIELESGFETDSWEAGFMQGWSLSHVGYLSQEMRAYALALFLRARAEDAVAAEAHLSDDKRRLLGRALRMLDRDRWAVERLSSLRPAR